MTAVRVANVDEDKFKEAVESDDPPTVIRLAQMGTKTRPEEETISVTAELAWIVCWRDIMHGVDWLVRGKERAAPDEIILGMQPEDRTEDHRKIKEALRLLNQLDALLGQLKVVD